MRTNFEDNKEILLVQLSTQITGILDSISRVEQIQKEMREELKSDYTKGNEKVETHIKEVELRVQRLELEMATQKLTNQTQDKKTSSLTEIQGWVAKSIIGVLITGTLGSIIAFIWKVILQK